MTDRETLTGRKQGSGRLCAALLLFLAFAAAGAFAARSAAANAAQMIGVDMTPTSGSTASSAGVDTCVAVGVGDTFEADVFATNIPNLTHFELRVEFDPAIVSLNAEASDFNHLLAKDGGAAQFIQVDEERPGRWFLGAADPQSPDSGSGTLVRLTFQALKRGASTVSIATQPKAAAAIIESTNQSFVGDVDGDSRWDGALTSGRVAVGGSCAGSSPVVTPAPTKVPQPTPLIPGQFTPAPTNGPGDGGEGSGGDGSGGDGSGGNGGQGSGGGTGSGPEETPDDIVGNIGSGSPGDGTGSGPDRGGDADGGAGGNDGGGGDQSAGSGGSSGTVLVVLGVIAAVLGLSAVTMLIWLRRGGPQAY